MPNRQSVYLDSCVIIDYLQGVDGNHSERLPDIDPIIEDARGGDVLIAVSALTITEVVRANPDGHPLSAEDNAKIQSFFQKEYIEVRPLTRSLAHASRAIVRANINNGVKKIKPNDAVHIAIDCGATVLYSYDDAHMTSQDEMHGNPPLPIKKPNAAHGTLWDQNNDREAE